MKCAYYIGDGGKVPAIVQKEKRVYADVKLLRDIRKRNSWELWEVPIEDLVKTTDFKIVSNVITGDFLVWNKS